MKRKEKFCYFLFLISIFSMLFFINLFFGQNSNVENNFSTQTTSRMPNKLNVCQARDRINTATTHVKGEFYFKCSPQDLSNHPVNNISLVFYKQAENSLLFLKETSTNIYGSFSFDLVSNDCFDQKDNLILVCKVILKNTSCHIYNQINGSNVLFEKTIIPQRFVINEDMNEIIYNEVIDQSDDFGHGVEVLQCITMGFDFFDKILFYTPTLVNVIYKSSRILSDFAHTTSNEIFLFDDDYSNWDLIQHEYAHFVLGLCNPNIRGCGVNHFITDDLSLILESGSEEVAWGEGLAEFFPMAIQKETVKYYSELYPSFQAITSDSSYSVVDSTYQVSKDYYLSYNYISSNQFKGGSYNEFNNARFLSFITYYNLPNQMIPHLSIQTFWSLIVDGDCSNLASFLSKIKSESELENFNYYGTLLETLGFSSQIEKGHWFYLDPTGFTTIELLHKNTFQKNDSCKLVFYQKLTDGTFKYITSYETAISENSIVLNLECTDTLLKSGVENFYCGIISYRTSDNNIKYGSFYSNLFLLKRLNVVNIDNSLESLTDINYSFPKLRYQSKYSISFISPIFSGKYNVEYFGYEDFGKNKDRKILIYSNLGVLIEPLKKEINMYNNALSYQFTLEKDQNYYIKVINSSIIEDGDTTLKVSYENYSKNIYFSSFLEASLNDAKLEFVFDFLSDGEYFFNLSIVNPIINNLQYSIYYMIDNIIYHYSTHIITSDNRGGVNTINVSEAKRFVLKINNYSMDNIVQTDVLRTKESSFSLQTDISTSDLVGTEVSLNGGARENNQLTIGFTRCFFLDNTAPTISRIQYSWYSSDFDVAEVSAYGTVKGKKKGKSTIICVLKTDHSIYSFYDVFVHSDDLTSIEYVSFGFDVRKEGVTCGTEVSINHKEVIPVSKRNESFVVTISNGYSRLICLGEDSPTAFIQDYIWESSNNEVVSVSSFGTLNALTTFSGNILVTGTHKYNNRFRINFYVQIV